MNDVTTLLHRALDDEPPLGFAPGDLVLRGRRTQRRRSFVLGGAGLAVVALVAASFAISSRDEPAGVTVAAPRSGTPGVPNPITKDNLARTVEQQLGIVFREVDVRNRDTLPSGASAVSLYGAVSDPAGDSKLLLHSYWLGAPRNLGTAPGCGSDFGNPDGETPDEGRYTGTCEVTPLANGAVLVVQSLRTPDGYARAVAMLFRPDGSGLNAESTNQDTIDVGGCVETATGKTCPRAPITRPDTGVSAAALGDLLVALEPATR